MRRSLNSASIVIALWMALCSHAADAQERNGTITGLVTDSARAILQGARVELEPAVASTVSNNQGDFTITGLAPGKYTLTISFVGLSPFSKEVTVTGGQVVRVNAELQVASTNESITVTAERVHGEAEAINRERTAENILQVLPAEVITSLPNANVADAIGRLPSVTLERDEGEGKYVQIRGTEPRYSNVTIDGVNVPAPESGVRQIKLDVIGSDLVESVEINKTLLANMDGDGIGGSVNLRTKSAGDQPMIALYGIGGYTPIQTGRTADQAGGTVSKRFGKTKGWGSSSAGRLTGMAAVSMTSSPRPQSSTVSQGTAAVQPLRVRTLPPSEPTKPRTFACTPTTARDSASPAPWTTSWETTPASTSADCTLISTTSATAGS